MEEELNMKERMIELILEAPQTPCIIGGVSSGRTFQTAKNIADHLLAAGATIPVRCKKCAHWGKRTENEKGFIICPVSGMKIHSEAFCSEGESVVGVGEPEDPA